MSATREQKAAVVAELQEKFSKVQGAVLADFRGMNVAQANQLRRRMREAGVEFKVVKNTLARRAAKEAGLDELEEHLVGPTAVAFGYDDPVTAAKALQSYIKEFGLLSVKAGVLEGRVISADEVKTLADLPGRDELLAKVAGGFTAPLAGFAGALSGVLRGLVNVLDGVRKQKEAAA
ncbi:MAG TPA: 50S ribosomal protein L10 [Sphingobacteriaceae bacterium]|nr:50S ribosomal protein L10 [Sphingobacteriaceae bacterium]